MNEEITKEQKELIEKLQNDKKIITEILKSQGKNYKTIPKRMKVGKTHE